MTLQLNDDKTEFLGIGTPQQSEKIDIMSICVGNSDIHPVPTARNLGSWFDSRLSMSKHITKICTSSFFYLYKIRRIRNYLSQTSTETLIYTFVSSRLNYCNSLLYGLPDSLLNKLQSVQNACAMNTNFATQRLLLWSYAGFQLVLKLSLKFFWLLLRFFMVKLRLIYHPLFLLGVHQNIILGTQMITFYLLILVSYPKQYLVIDPELLWSSGMLCHSMSDAPSLLMFLI